MSNYKSPQQSWILTFYFLHFLDLKLSPYLEITKLVFSLDLEKTASRFLEIMR